MFCTMFQPAPQNKPKIVGVCWVSRSKDMKKSLTTVVLLAISLAVAAQGGTNSPYSQYGFGSLADQSTGYSRGMNGLALGSRDSKQINFLNPASYSSIDSLTFIFDVGMSGQLTNFEENGKKINAKNAAFEYAVGAFRLFKNVGVSFGILPYSNVGYSFSSTNKVGDVNSTTYTNTYSGSGGLRQVYFGMGWQLFKGFSIGANGSYLWGEYDRSIVNSYSDTYVNTISKYYTASVSSYKVDAGAQITIPFSKKSNLTMGFTYSLGNKLGADPKCLVVSTNSQTSVADTATYTVKDGLQLPVVMSGGMMLNLNGKLRVGADYQLQKWADVSYPVYSVVNGAPLYNASKNYFKDRHKVTIGGEYCKNAMSTRFFDRIKFRAGASYATPYLLLNGKDGPKEISVSAGFGIPLVNAWNNRSTLNISGQWVRNDATSMLRENTFRINLGITFNERWFMKWKVD